jgi:hypothetical protein
MPSAALRVHVEHHVATLTLNRPEKRNAITFEMWSEIAEIVTQLSALPAARILVVEGEGEHFCAGADISGLRPSRNVWYRDASYVDASGTANFTAQETQEITNILSQVGSLFRTISPRTLNEIATNDTYKIEIKAWNNLKVREGKEITDTSSHVTGLILRVEEKLNKSILEAKKADTKKKRQMEKTIVMNFYRNNRNELKKIFDLQNLLVRAKNMIVRKLQSAKDTVETYLRTDEKGLKITNAEGFVAIDHIGNAVKLVDRLEFSQANFNATKNWSK